jgi:hypothetical protein
MLSVNMILILPERLDFHRFRALGIKTDIYYSAILTVQAEPMLLSVIA